MNERIKEIAEQAKEVSHWLDGGYTPVYRTNLEKFAELIVRECVDIIEKLPSGYKDYRDQIEDAFRIASVVEIKHHFGVEE